MAGNLSCGKQVWSTMRRFSGFPSSLPPCMSFLPKPGSSYTISLLSSLSSLATNTNPVINTSLMHVLCLIAVSSTKLVQKMPSLRLALQKQPGWCCCLFKQLMLLLYPSLTVLSSVIPVQQGRGSGSWKLNIKIV